MFKGHHQPGKRQGYPENKNPAVCQTSGYIHDFLKVPKIADY